jgi:ABC-type uncharacterized transport system fused permease/ATPase subunit
LGFYNKTWCRRQWYEAGDSGKRLVIARAVYKNPKFIFFDEATNSFGCE